MNPTIKFWAFNLLYMEGKASRKGELTQLTGKMNSISCTGLPLHSIPQVTSVAEKERKGGWLRKGTSYLAFEELQVYSGSATQHMSEKMLFSSFYPSKLHIFHRAGDVSRGVGSLKLTWYNLYLKMKELHWIMLML